MGEGTEETSMVVGIAPRLAGVCMILAASSVHAQSLTSRLSEQQFDTVYGGGGDVIFAGLTESRTTLDPFDTMALNYKGFHAGVVPGKPEQPFTASVRLDVAQEYVINGSLSAISRIQASGSTEVFTGVTGAGVAQMISINPGNRLEFGFSIASTTDVRLAGEVSLDPGQVPFSGAGVSLLRFDGVTWLTVFSSAIELPDSEGTFDLELSLMPGDYRLIGESLGNAFSPGGSPGQENSWSYDLILCQIADLNCDGVVNGADLSILLAAWGPCAGCAADLNQDGVVNGADLSILLANWS